jgi:hypothetical protein
MPAQSSHRKPQLSRAEEKRLSREADARALASGLKSVAELKLENEVFARLAGRMRVDLPASRSLG